MKKRMIAVGVVCVAFLVAPAFAAPSHERNHKPAPVRLTSVTQSGSDLTLRLEDGRTVQLESHRVHIRDKRLRESAAANGARQGRTMSPAQLTSMSSGGSLPAVATLIYGRDGSVRRARIEVFKSSSDVTAFLEKSASKPASKQ